MEKIPTLFVRDKANPDLVTREVHPDCGWVIDGEGYATRKYDGTCVGLFPAVKGEVRLFEGIGSGEVNEPGDLTAVWLARRQIRPGRTMPPGYIPVVTDPATGKTQGWEPVEQSSFRKVFAEVLDREGEPREFGTYELCGPTINGNPERLDRHGLIRHYTAQRLDVPARDFDALMEWLEDRPQYEGIVWHHPDGRMAKLKRRDALAVNTAVTRKGA